MRPPPPRSPLYPYTTLFRSRGSRRRQAGRGPFAPAAGRSSRPRVGATLPERTLIVSAQVGRNVAPATGKLRSEEHTSELQSLTNLVCRLLLEKKKINRTSDV